MREELDLHARHVDPRRTFALAALAGDAQIERCLDRLVTLRAELSGEREAQRVGAPARQVDLVARRAIRRAHGPGVELAAVAVVVAHLDGLVETAPLAPVENGARHLAAVTRLVAKERCIVPARRVGDLPRIHRPARTEPRLDLGEGPGEARAEEWRDPLGAHQPIAVLARIGA